MPHAVASQAARVPHPVFKRQTRATFPQHILDCLPEPPVGPPPALADRSTWIESLEPWRRRKIRDDGVALHSFTGPLTTFPTTPLDDSDAVVVPNVRQSPSSDESDQLLFSSCPSEDDSEEIFSLADSPYVLPRKSDAVAGWVASVAASRTIAAGNADRAAPPAHDTAIVHYTPGSSRRRLSDCGSQSSVPRPKVPRRDSAAAVLTPSRSIIIDDIAGACDREAASVSCASSGDGDDEAGNFLDSDSFSGPSDASSRITDACAASVDSIDSDDWENTQSLAATPFDRTGAHQVGEVAPVVIESNVHRSPRAVHAVAADHDAPSKTLRVVTASQEHKDLLVHLSDWAAEYVWRIVTTGSSINSVYRKYHLNETQGFPVDPPAYLVDAIKGCLLSTLLQPSAIFLALWYIVRLPVFLGEAAYEPETSAYHFRRVLLGEGVVPFRSREKHNLELYAPFKLFVNGILLASKTLDDHTYSNRCWHEVSRIQIRDINALELYSLDLLQYDLTVPHEAWVQWLVALRSHHRALAPYPTPIGPVKDTPHSLILRLFDRMIAASSPNLPSGLVAPIFFGVDDHVKSKPEHLQAESESEWDLDENGPMKTEYRRARTRRPSPQPQLRRTTVPASLPPPAAWSPAADPPLDTNRSRPQYLAVQRPSNDMVYDAGSYPGNSLARSYEPFLHMSADAHRSHPRAPPPLFLGSVSSFNPYHALKEHHRPGPGTVMHSVPHLAPYRPEVVVDRF